PAPDRRKHGCNRADVALKRRRPDAHHAGRQQRPQRRPMSFGCCAGLPTDTTRLEGITAMAKVISTLFISADGVAEIDPDWHFPYFDDNMGRAVGEDYDTADVLLIGRETYDSFAGAWPGRDAPYHLTVMATETFPTGVIRVIYSPAKAPAKVGYDEVKDQVPSGK